MTPRLAGLALLVLIPGLAQAGAGLTPGLWEITLATRMPGLVIPPTKKKLCLDAKAADLGSATILLDELNTCRMSDWHVEGSAATWKMTCTDMEGTGRVAFQPDRLQGQTDLTLRVDNLVQEVKHSHAGRRLGDCPAK